MNDILTQAQKAQKAWKFEEALQLYEKMLSQTSHELLALEGVIYCLYNLQRNEEATAMCAKALAINSNLLMPHIVLAYIYHGNGDKIKSWAEANTALELVPDSAEALCCYGILLSFDEKIEEAIQYLSKAVEIDPEMYLAHYNLSFCYQKNGDLKSARSQIGIMYQLKPNFWNFIRIPVAYFAANRILYGFFLMMPLLVFVVQLKALFVFHVIIMLMHGSSALIAIKHRMWRETINILLLITFIAVVDAGILAMIR